MGSRSGTRSVFILLVKKACEHIILYRFFSEPKNDNGINICMKRRDVFFEHDKNIFFCSLYRLCYIKY